MCGSQGIEVTFTLNFLSSVKILCLGTTVKFSWFKVFLYELVHNHNYTNFKSKKLMVSAGATVKNFSRSRGRSG